MKIKSYAKINLTLDILRKRPDNFHELETVFQHIDLSDELELKSLDEDVITIKCNYPQLENESNICYKAASIIKTNHTIQKGVLISINKTIPMGAGLSGGSSNAAAVLKGLNYLWDLGLSDDTLIEYSKEIGMDVAFHILGGTCVGRGRGELLEKLDDLPEHHVIVVYPGFALNTALMYGSLDYDKIGKQRSTADFIKTYDICYLHNDFEFSVYDAYPRLIELKKALGDHAILSGSGSCVFGIYTDEATALDTYELLKQEYDDVFLTKTLNKKIITADEMGFCSGVRRAILKIKETHDDAGVAVLGQLVHNKQVIDDITGHGITMIDDIEQADKGSVVISAHGVPDATITRLEDRGLTVVDLTCPLVKKVHDITKAEEQAGRKIIIYGDKNHTEVKGITGNLTDYRVIKDISELPDDDCKSPLSIVAQTTREEQKFNDITEAVTSRCTDVTVIDTICNPTKKRQQSARDVAADADIVVVIGGKNSSNTKRLVEICKQSTDAVHIETAADLDDEWFLEKNVIGITAGASTPDNTIEQVIDRLRLLL